MSISLRKINAIFLKQLINSYKNPNIVVTALMSPIFAYIYFNLFAGQNQQVKVFLLGMCLVMNVVMVGTLMMTYMISEEKEKNTLSVLMTSTVSPADYLIGNGITTWIVTVIMGVVLVFISGITENMVNIMVITAISSIAAIVLGAVVGLISKNQINASIISLPFVMVLIMFPNIAQINPTLKKISQVLFTQHVYNAITGNAGDGVDFIGIIIILANIAVFTAAFFILYRYKRLDD